MKHQGVVVAAALVVAGFAAFAVWAIRQNPRLPEGEADRVLQQAVSLIREQALMAEGADWDLALRHARQQAARGGRMADLDEALQGLVQPLRARDGHSFYLPAAQARSLQSPTAAAAAEALVVRDADQGDVPVLRINAWASFDETVNTRAAADGAALLSAALSAHPCGLVLDLRANGGGNMYPMLQAVSALLPPGDLGFFQTRDGQRMAWPVPARSVPARAAAVAVLLGPQTASSGEFLAVGLRSAPRLRSFGAATAGLTTGNAAHALPHGGLLALTTARMLDAQGRPVNGRLAPDEDHDQPMAPAAAWVKAQCATRPAGA